MEELSRREREQLERKELIITIAEELFYKFGFEKVSMDYVAEKSEFTKRTLYRYFTCKEDLVFAVALRGYQSLYEMLKVNRQKAGNGFDKIRLSYYSYYDYLCNNPHLVQIFSMSGTAKSSSAGLNIPYQQKYMDIDRLLFEELIQMFVEGKSDGSIRSDLDISHLAFSSIFVAVGFFQMFALTGSSYTKHFGMNKEEFVRFTIEMLVESLKNK